MQVTSTFNGYATSHCIPCCAALILIQVVSPGCLNHRSKKGKAQSAFTELWHLAMGLAQLDFLWSTTASTGLRAWSGRGKKKHNKTKQNLQRRSLASLWDAHWPLDTSWVLTDLHVLLGGLNWLRLDDYRSHLSRRPPTPQDFGIFACFLAAMDVRDPLSEKSREDFTKVSLQDTEKKTHGKRRDRTVPTIGFLHVSLVNKPVLQYLQQRFGISQRTCFANCR